MKSEKSVKKIKKSVKKIKKSVKKIKKSGGKSVKSGGKWKQFTDIYGTIRVKYYPSDSKNKKWMVYTPKGKKIHFGAPNMEDYTQHHDKERRRRFRLRMAGVRLKDGSRAIDHRYTPAWLSYYCTW